MNPFTAIKNLTPFHFTSIFIVYFILFFHLSYQQFTSLYFDIHIYNSLPFNSLHFPSIHFTSLHFLVFIAFTSATVLHFPNPRFENMRFTVESPDRPFR